MKPQERMDWIESYMEQDSVFGVDVLNADFVADYIIATAAPFIATNYGAHKCPQLSRDLSKMASDGILRRARVGISGLGPDFPKWVYTYTLPN
jgi:hypothetical protein